MSKTLTPTATPATPIIVARVGSISHAGDNTWHTLCPVCLAHVVGEVGGDIGSAQSALSLHRWREQH